MIQLIPLTKDNYISVVELCVTPEQEKFVGTVAEAIADAYFRPCEMRALTIDNKPVGFMMWDESKKAEGIIVLVRLLIDCHHQRKGYARDALTQWISMHKHVYLKLSTLSTNHNAIALYSSLGFVMSSFSMGNKNYMSGVLIRY